MALSPELSLEENEEEVTGNDLLNLKTYRFDFETKRLTSQIISGLDAIKQFILIALHIPRYAYAIYSADTGNELEELIADNELTPAFKIMEVERLVTEALIYDARIERVYDFDIKQVQDAFNVHFKVDTIIGELEFEEVLAS
ncbi:DUF2634 domain-containing protein [Peribacillus loiseleuriae]|uniref:DUF2634 domain-containing protein n=1 Tax=Peribacillus loiseleuriae TaxID=1679170 RepID=UPI003CFF6DD8